MGAPRVHEQRTGAGTPASGSSPSGTSASSPPASLRNRRRSQRASTARTSPIGIPLNDATSAAEAGPNARR